MQRFASFKLSMLLIDLSLVSETVEEEVRPSAGVFIRAGPRMKRPAFQK
jgi:hypothetical protein